MLDSFFAGRALERWRNPRIRLAVNSDAGFWWSFDYTWICRNPMRADGGDQKCTEVSPRQVAATELDGVWLANGPNIDFVHAAGQVSSLRIPAGFAPIHVSSQFFHSGTQLILPEPLPDAGLQWEILSDEANATGWVQDDHIWLSRPLTDVIALPRRAPE